MTDDDTFAARWARRKRAVAEEEAAAKIPPSAPESDVEETEEEALARLGLPDPDSLGEGDDFSGFMRAGVPAVLRRRALRRLWTTNPVLANVDGLVEYGENYASPDLIPEAVATAYKVGKGFVKKLAEAGENDRPPEEFARTSAADEVLPESAEAGEESAGRDALSHPSEPGETSEQAEASAGDAEIVFQPRRMRFRTNT